MAASSRPSLSIALGGGGAAGLGHIPVLQAVEDLDLRPVAVAGTSIGAVIGAAWAAGHSAADLRDHVSVLADDALGVARRFLQTAEYSFQTNWLSLDPVAALAAILPEAMPDRIEDLDIPLTIVATDYHARKARYFTDGPLVPALAASIAIPGIFRAQRIDDRVLVDGGVTDNLPVAGLPETDICLAVDCATLPPSESRDIPKPTEAIVGAMRIMMRALLSERLAARDGLVVIRPESSRYGALDFDRTLEILDSAGSARAETRDALRAAIDATG
jgi:NTE family protein